MIDAWSFGYDSAFFGPFFQRAEVVRLFAMKEYIWCHEQELWENDQVAATVLSVPHLLYMRYLINSGRVSEW